MPVSTECAAALLSFRYPSNSNKNKTTTPMHKKYKTVDITLYFYVNSGQ